MVSILILVDIGLVPIRMDSDTLNKYRLNPYSCGYRTGTCKIMNRSNKNGCLNPYSCGYRTGTVMLDVQRNSVGCLNPYSCGYRTGTVLAGATIDVVQESQSLFLWI